MKIKLGQLRKVIKSVVKESSEKTWTAFVRWNGEDYTMEEIDVKAPNERIARKLAQQELDRDYQPGGEIVAIEPARLMQVWSM